MPQPTAQPAELSKYEKPWNGIPRDLINWNPTVDEAACIGCGLCVTTCGREVYRFDFDHKRSAVVSPFHCMVGCSTCGNLCPTYAISFPETSTVQALLSRPEVHQQVEDKLLARAAELTFRNVLPQADRMVRAPLGVGNTIALRCSRHGLRADQADDRTGAGDKSVPRPGSFLGRHGHGGFLSTRSPRALEGRSSQLPLHAHSADRPPGIRPASRRDLRRGNRLCRARRKHRPVHGSRCLHGW